MKKIIESFIRGRIAKIDVSFSVTKLENGYLVGNKFVPTQAEVFELYREFFIREDN